MHAESTPMSILEPKYNIQERNSRVKANQKSSREEKRVIPLCTLIWYIILLYLTLFSSEETNIDSPSINSSPVEHFWETAKEIKLGVIESKIGKFYMVNFTRGTEK